MRNIALQLSFHGTPFEGWQSQSHGRTVQDHVERALAELVGGTIRVFGCSRTDAGVHALSYVANFQTDSTIPCRNIQKALNAQLSPDIVVQNVSEVSESFEARRCGREKTYRYIIHHADEAAPLLIDRVWHWRSSLQPEAMQEAAATVIGQHDFSSFAAASDDQPSKIREMYSSTLEIHQASAYYPGFAPLPGTCIVYTVTGQAFLKHMVRNIVGTLLDIGRGQIEAGAMPAILAARDRCSAGRCAPACGLYLVGTRFEELGLS